MDEPTSALSAAGGRGAVQGHRGPDRPRRGDRLHLPPPRGGASRSPTTRSCFRDGELVATAERSRHRPRLDRAPNGRRAISPGVRLPDRARDFGDVALSIENLTVADAEDAGRLASSTTSRCEVRAGEIVCIYGLMGAGRTELIEASPAASRSPAGACCSAAGTSRGPSHRRSASTLGLVLVPEDRQRDGLVQTMSVGAEPVAGQPRCRSSSGSSDLAHARGAASVESAIRDVHVKTAGPRRADHLADRAATSRRSSSARCCSPTPRCCCSTSRPAASTSAPRPRSSACCAERPQGARRPLRHLRGRRVPEHRRTASS